MPLLPEAYRSGLSKSVSKTLNLIFVHQREKISHVDVEVIGEKIASLAPEIRIFGVDPRDDPDVISKEDWKRPTLTVSFGPVRRFIPPRGPIYENHVVSKLDQFRKLVSSGVETPHTALYKPGMSLNPAEFGPLVILKPLDPRVTSTGKYLQVFRTASLSGRALPPDHPSCRMPMLVQSFIDTGENMRSHRCLTLFGVVLYANMATCSRMRPPLDAPDSEIEAMSAEPVRPEMKLELYEDAELFAFASRMAAAFPTHPILGCDILRQADTGKLYAIEINGGGNVWHFSSQSNESFRSFERTQILKRRFSSFDKAAEILVRKTREEAR